MRIQEVTIRGIIIDSPGWDDFVFTEGRSAAPVAESIARFGLLNPLALRRDGRKSCKVVCGSLRLRALIELGRKTCVARVFSAKDLPEGSALELSLCDNLLGRGLNEMEKANCLERFRRVAGYADERLAASVAPLLGIAATPEAALRHLGLCQMDAAMRASLAAGEIGVQEALLYSELPPAEGSAAFELLVKACRASYGESKEILRNMREVAKARSMTLWELCADGEIARISADSGMAPQAKRAAVRAWAFAIRYPGLAKRRAELSSAVGAAKLGRAAAVGVDPNLEGDGVAVTLKASSQDELEKAVSTLSARLSEGKLARIFSLLRG
jgi:hypothetical protein